MAVFPYEAVTPVQPINIEAWTEQATQSFTAVSLASSGHGEHGTSTNLSIDIDEQKSAEEPREDGYRPRREPLRRDSLKRREALLKGKEGSRRRRQWENDRLLNNPWAQPPLPSDWEVHPTHPKHTVPYYLAPLWDQDAKARAEARKREQVSAMKKAQEKDEGQGKVPKELREKLKKAKAAKGLLRDLEEQVRMFVKNFDGKGEETEKAELDSEDEMIVFVGRNGKMRDVPFSPKFRDSIDEEDLERERLVFESLEQDRGANFGRWLVHSIATYYGLRTWSVTVGDPARREAYVGIPQEEARPASPVLPRPLWGMV